jgi:hypothetical protein
MNPDQWSNFFVLVGGGSAALTGLVFVAITINLRRVAELMGRQTDQTVGAEWLVVSVLAAVVNTNGYVQAFRLRGSSRYALSPLRIIGGSACYLGQIVGAVMLLLGSDAGIYVAAVALIANFTFLISGSWLLIVGTFRVPD